MKIPIEGPELELLTLMQRGPEIELLTLMKYWTF